MNDVSTTVSTSIKGLVFLILAATGLLGASPAQAAACFQSLQAACANCNAHGQLNAEKNGPYCLGCGRYCIVASTDPSAIDSAKTLAASLGGEPYARASENVVVYTHDQDKLVDRDALGETSSGDTRSIGILIDEDMLRSIGQKDILAATLIALFHPNHWFDEMNLLAGEALTQALQGPQHLERLLQGDNSYDESSPLEKRLSGKAAIRVSWTGKSIDDDMLLVTFVSEAVDDDFGQVPARYTSTVTQIWVSKSESSVVSFAQISKDQPSDKK